MAKKKPIVSSLGQWAYPGEVTIIPSNQITMQDVNYPVLGIDNLGNQQVMMPGMDYIFPGDYVTEIPEMGKGGLTQWFAEKWVDVKTGKPCGRSGKDKDGRPYPACRPSKRVNETTPKTSSEMSPAEKAKFKREKTSGKRIDYNHKRRQDGGENWLNNYQDGGEEPNPEDIEKMEPIIINSRVGNKQVSKRQTDLDREINTGYNIWDKLKNKANQFLLNMFVSNPTLTAQTVAAVKGVDKGIRKIGDRSKEFIYNNYRPVEYPDMINSLMGLTGNAAPPLTDSQGKLIPGEEAYRLALGLPTEQNYIVPSKYKPTSSTDPNMSYYTMPDVFNPQALIEAYMEEAQNKPGQKVNIKRLAPYIKNEDRIDSKDLPFEQTDPLQNFQLSQGSDDRGNYISLYDIYDFGAPFDQLIYGSNRKPIEFYDRFYYTTGANNKPVYKPMKKMGGWLNKYN